MSGNIDLSKDFSKVFWSDLPEEGGHAHYDCYTPLAVPQDEIPCNIVTPKSAASQKTTGPVPQIPCF